MYQRGDLKSQTLLGLAPLGPLGHGTVEDLDLLPRQERELAQVPAHVAVVGADPELEELVRTGALRIEPDRSAFGLAELGAVGLGDERPRQPVGDGALVPADEVDAFDDVAVLVAATHLQPAA